MTKKKQKIIHLSHWQYTLLSEFHALDPKVIYYAEENENPEIAKLIVELKKKKEKEKMFKNKVETIIDVLSFIGTFAFFIWLVELSKPVPTNTNINLKAE